MADILRITETRVYLQVHLPTRRWSMLTEIFGSENHACREIREEFERMLDRMTAAPPPPLKEPVRNLSASSEAYRNRKS